MQLSFYMAGERFSIRLLNDFCLVVHSRRTYNFCLVEKLLWNQQQVLLPPKHLMATDTCKLLGSPNTSWATGSLGWLHMGLFALDFSVKVTAKLVCHSGSPCLQCQTSPVVTLRIAFSARDQSGRFKLGNKTKVAK